MLALQANSTRMATDEIAMLPLMSHANVIELLDHFTFQGVFGTHVALVYPLLGRDVRPDAVGARKGVNAARDVARGVLRALVEINKHGIIHTDIKCVLDAYVCACAVVVVCVCTCCFEMLGAHHFFAGLRACTVVSLCIANAQQTQGA